MTIPSPPDDQAQPAADGELISRLRVIEQQTLDERASAYAALHDQLAHTLESGHPESPRPHG